MKRTAPIISPDVKPYRSYRKFACGHSKTARWTFPSHHRCPDCQVSLRRVEPGLAAEIMALAGRQYDPRVMPLVTDDPAPARSRVAA